MFLVHMGPTGQRGKQMLTKYSCSAWLSAKGVPAPPASRGHSGGHGLAQSKQPEGGRGASAAGGHFPGGKVHEGRRLASVRGHAES